MSATSRTAVPCCHCGRRMRPVARGLCSLCHRTLSIRRRYAPGNVARRGSGQVGTGAEPQPTREPPGSAGKLLALAARAERGERLFTAGDAVLA